MSESKQRSRSRAAILATFSRCIYCESSVDLTIEHMPPRGFFKGKDRPSGWEFACCKRCNQGTRGADAVAQLISKFEAITAENWKISDNEKIIDAIDKYAPGVIEEIFSRKSWSEVLVRKNGILYPAISKQINGANTRHHLDLFSAKCAMAAFAQFTGRPVEANGLLYTRWHTNGGMTPERFALETQIMPMFSNLTQGAKNSGTQFHCRYNTNLKDLVAGLFALHNSLFISFVATDGSEFIEPLREILSKFGPGEHLVAQITTPGLSEIDNQKLASHY